MVRQSSELETNIVAVERIKEYTGITREVCNFWNSNQTSARLIKPVNVPSVTQIVLPHTSVIPIPACRHSRFQSIPGLTSFNWFRWAYHLDFSLGRHPQSIFCVLRYSSYSCSQFRLFSYSYPNPRGPGIFFTPFADYERNYVFLLTGWLDNSRSPSPWGMALPGEDRDREFPTALQRASSPGAERHELRH